MRCPVSVPQWCDYFCLRQCRDDFQTDAIEDAIGFIGHTVGAMFPKIGSRNRLPEALNRIFCIFELGASVRTEAHLSAVCWPMIKGCGITSGPLPDYVGRAQAFDEDDKRRILVAIDSIGGMHGGRFSFNRTAHMVLVAQDVSEILGEWVVCMFGMLLWGTLLDVNMLALIAYYICSALLTCMGLYPMWRSSRRGRSNGGSPPELRAPPDAVPPVQRTALAINVEGVATVMLILMWILSILAVVLGFMPLVIIISPIVLTVGLLLDIVSLPCNLLRREGVFRRSRQQCSNFVTWAAPFFVDLWHNFSCPQSRGTARPATGDGHVQCPWVQHALQYER